MERVEWSTALEIGDKEIDSQHRIFIDIINKLQDAFFSDEVGDTTEIQISILQELLEYTKYHFSYEEQRMRDAQYPDVAAHWRLHKDFEQATYEKYRRLTLGDCVLNSELLMFIRTWLVNHILKEDQKFAAHLRDTQAIHS